MTLHWQGLVMGEFFERRNEQTNERREKKKEKKRGKYYTGHANAC